MSRHGKKWLSKKECERLKKSKHFERIAGIIEDGAFDNHSFRYTALVVVKYMEYGIAKAAKEEREANAKILDSWIGTVEDSTMLEAMAKAIRGKE